MGGIGLSAIESASRLRLLGNVSQNETVAFRSGTGVLDVGDPGNFLGTVTGFGIGDTIDVLNTLLTGIVFEPCEDMLVLEQGGVGNAPTLVGTIDLTGDFTSDDFIVGPDGAGGSQITLTPGVPVGTLLDMAKASYDTTLPASLDGFTEIASVNSGNGFQAVAYKMGNQVVVAFRGTFQGNLPDFLKNVIADSSWGTGAPDATLRDYTQRAAQFLAQVQTNNPGATVTVTGHSLGGALAQLVAGASGDPAVTFDAPGPGNFYSALSSQLAPAAALNTGAIGTITNYRMVGDQVSQAGRQMGSTINVTGTNPTDWLHALDNHSLDNMITALTNNASQDCGSPESPLPGLVPVLSATGPVLSVFLPVVFTAIQYGIDPLSGREFTLTEQSGSALLDEIGLPDLPGVAHWNISLELNGSPVASEQAPPDTMFSDPSGFDSATFEPLDTLGDPMKVGSFITAVEFAQAGTFSAQLTGIACFMEGTRILTANGPVLVEMLRAGDQVMTVEQGVRCARPLVWIGHRRIDPRRHPEPDRVWPIVIRHDAIADGMPDRDLFVSPDHALCIDDVLVPAGLLLNHASIARAPRSSPFRYFHLELDRHSVLLAENMTAESYLDTGNRAMFENGGPDVTLHPRFDGGDAEARRMARSALPFVDDPVKLERIWRRIADRSAWSEEGGAWESFTADPALSVIAGGRSFRSLQTRPGRYTFALSAAAGGVRLMSRAARPCDTRPWLGDRRRLGVAVTRLTVRARDGQTTIPLDHPEMARGWWDLEESAGGSWRWTNGDAFVPIDVDGPAILEVEIGPSMLYADPRLSRRRRIEPLSGEAARQAL
jgi:hypothetical protein